MEEKNVKSVKKVYCVFCVNFSSMQQALLGLHCTIGKNNADGNCKDFNKKELTKRGTQE